MEKKNRSGYFGILMMIPHVMVSEDMENYVVLQASATRSAEQMNFWEDVIFNKARVTWKTPIQNLAM